ncbi:MAG TPA: hypothetical protein VFP61_12910 [Acidimicrobiales bacterium]|nr:hypothetical protein [Acidimicrobiales bacterium]
MAVRLGGAGAAGCLAALAAAAGTVGGASAGAAPTVASPAPALVVTADPCGPGPTPGACGADPTALSVTWPGSAVVGGVVVTWQQAGRPAGAPSPSAPAAGLATTSGQCRRADDGSTATCTWPWPAALHAAGAQVLNGTYAVAACRNDPTAGAPTSSSTTPGTDVATTTPTTAATTTVPPTTSSTSPTTAPFLPFGLQGATAASAGGGATSGGSGAGNQPAGDTTSGGSGAGGPSTAATSPSGPQTPTCDDAGVAGGSLAVAVAPARPANLTVADGSPNELRWAAGGEDDLAGYEVARDGATVWACHDNGAAVGAAACPQALVLDDPAPAGPHTWAVTALRLPADPSQPLLVSPPATAKATSSGATAVGLPKVPGFVPPAPARPVAAPRRVAPASPRAAVTTTTDPGYGVSLPYQAGTSPGAVALSQPEDGAGGHPGVGRAALAALAALLVAVAAHLVYLNSLLARRQVEAAAARRRSSAAEGATRPPG